MPHSRTALALCSLLAFACSSEDKKASTTTPETSQTWTRLISGEWTLGVGMEEPRHCVTKTLDRDIYVSAIRPVHPPGTHHTILSVADSSSDCVTSLIGNGVLYGAGVGSEGLTLPKGVAMKLPKGKILNLGLHLYNVTNKELKGESAIEIVEMDAKDVKFESEALLSGPFSLSIPPGKEQVVTHECPITQDQTVWAVFPHMHQMGRHLKTTLEVGGKADVIHDADYDFQEQFQIPIDPVELHPGDSIRTECTFDNETTHTVSFGESSDTEMCFSLMFRYPALGQAFCGASSGGTALPGPACAKPGSPGNDVKVGQECSKGGGECASNDYAQLCLADVTSGDFGNFCSHLCVADAECGEGAHCLGEEGRRACIPEACATSLAPRDAGAAATDGG